MSEIVPANIPWNPTNGLSKLKAMVQGRTGKNSKTQKRKRNKEAHQKRGGGR